MSLWVSTASLKVRCLCPHQQRRAHCEQDKMSHGGNTHRAVRTSAFDIGPYVRGRHGGGIHKLSRGYNLHDAHDVPADKRIPWLCIHIVLSGRVLPQVTVLRAHSKVVTSERITKLHESGHLRVHWLQRWVRHSEDVLMQRYKLRVVQS